MKRSEIRAFIKSGVDTLSPKITFNSGRITEFNSNRSNEYPYVWLESLSGGDPSEAVEQTWNVAMHIAKLDKADSSPEQYEALIDECDEIAQRLVIQYRNQLNGSNRLVIGDATRDPFIHKHADDTTGVILTFTITDYLPIPIC